MAPRNEAPWLTKLYAAVGFVLLFCVLGALYLAVAFWPLSLLIAAAGIGLWWYYRSVWGLERHAREETERLYEHAKRLNDGVSNFVDPEDFSKTVIDAVRDRPRQPRLACCRFRRHRVRCFDGTGGVSWRDGSLHASSSLRLCG
jgi:hypothetical protein